MKKFNRLRMGLLWCTISICSAQGIAHAVDGTVTKIDTDSKTITVDTARGTTDTFHYVDRTTVLGSEDTAGKTDNALSRLKEGDKVAVHYTTEGTEKTVHEVDRLGEGGLLATEGTVSHFDRGAKTIAIKTKNGGEKTYQLSDEAIKAGGTDITDGAQKSGKVVLYYADEGGQKTAHFVKRIF